MTETHALVLSDLDNKPPLSEDLRSRIRAALEQKGYLVEAIEVGASDIVPCTGCLTCHMKADGVCVHEDALTSINARIGSIDLVCLLGPIVFGQFSSTMKSVADKLKCFRMRARHVIAIGFGEDIRDDEADTFIDIVKKHGGAANVVHPKFMSRNDVYVSRSPRDNERVCEQLRSSL